MSAEFLISNNFTKSDTFLSFGRKFEFNLLFKFQTTLLIVFPNEIENLYLIQNEQINQYWVKYQQH